MKALDLFCGAGGAGMGLWQAGFDVTGVDINPQPRYPFKFVQADALTFDLSGYDLIWASPPCQAYSRAQKIRGRKHPDLIKQVRKRLKDSAAAYCIENVEGAPLINPITLCGQRFDLKTYRHRLFETNFHVPQPIHIEHRAPIAKMGRKPKPNEFIHVVGNFSGVEEAKRAMGINWMTRNELSESIPPAYSRYIGIWAHHFLCAKRLEAKA